MDFKIFFRAKLIPNEQIGIPFFNFYEEQEHIGNLLKNNFFEKETEYNLKEYIKHKFFNNNFTSLVCPKKEKCHDFSYQNEYEYSLCKQTKSLYSFSLYEIILIILLFVIIINVLFFSNTSSSYIRSKW